MSGRPGLARRCMWRIVIVGPVLCSDAQSGFRGFGHPCENPLCQWVVAGLRCSIIGRDVRGTAQVVNESGSAVLAASLER